MTIMKEKFAKFMAGRYGTDRLNQFMLIVLLVCAVINLFIRNGYVSILLTSWEVLLIVFIYIRMFSRKLTKRYAENQKYLAVENKVRHFFGQYHCHKNIFRFYARKNIFSSRERTITFIPVQAASRRSVFPREKAR